MYAFADNGEFITLTTDGTRSIDIKKKYIKTLTSGVYLVLIWHDKERRRNTYEKWIDYNDVTSPVVASAAALETQIDAWINSGGGCAALTVKQETGDYTLALGDECNFIEIDDDGTGTVTILVPDNATEPFEIGTRIEFVSITTENVDFVPDTGVTINSSDAHSRLNNQFSCAKITKVDTDEWVLCGDIKEAYDPEASAYIDAYESAGGLLTVTQKGYINDLVVGLKADGLWTKLNAFYPMLGTSADMQKWNLIDPQDTNAAFRLTFTGSPTYAMTGITFNGTTQFANTNLAPASVLTQDSTHIGAVSRNDVNAGIQMYVQNAATTTLGIIMRLAGSAYSDHYNQGTNRITVGSFPNSIGHYISTRTTSIVHKYFKAGVQIGTTNTNASVSFAGLAALTMYIGARNSNGTANSFCANELNCVHIGSGLSDADVTALTSRVATFNSNFSR